MHGCVRNCGRDVAEEGFFVAGAIGDESARAIHDDGIKVRIAIKWDFLSVANITRRVVGMGNELALPANVFVEAVSGGEFSFASVRDA